METIADATPGALFRSFIAYQLTAALRAAIELDVFTAIGAGAGTAAELARRSGAAERGVRILADYLVVQGFLTKTDGRYGLAPIAASFLDRTSPVCLAPAIGFLASPLLLDTFAVLTASVRSGRSAAGERAFEPDHPMWVEFARAMAPIAGMTAEMLAIRLDAGGGGHGKVLDIAAGHGLFGIALARHDPGARIVALDWPAVLAVAAENARAAGVAHRFSTPPGSALEVEFGDGYDTVLLTNFLHHFDPAGCEKILRKVHRALAPGGRAVTVEFVPDESRVAPPEAAGFALVMLATTPAGDAYTFAEFGRLFRYAGFTRSELHQLEPSPQQLIVSRK